MKVLVANLGSTSFKYRLFDLEHETQLARGGIDRIGQPDATSTCFAEIGTHRSELRQAVPNHAAAVSICLQQLTDAEHGCLESVDEVGGIGFKAVFAGSLSGVRIVDEPLLQKMEALSDIAPAHNPPYVRAMRQLQQAFPQIPLVAALETGFHETIPFEHRAYAVPWEWYTQHEIRRWGFHGASHRFIAGRTAELLGRTDLKIISCHLGGSASVCAISGGASVAASMGMSPQGGLPNNNRVGDFDPYAIPVGTLARIVPQLIQRGRVIRPDAGISRVYQSDAGLVVATLTAGGPAERAGLRGFKIVRERRRQGPFMMEFERVDRAGADLIVAVGGQGVRTADDFLSAVESKNPGDQVLITVQREGHRLDIPVVLDAEK